MDKLRKADATAGLMQAYKAGMALLDLLGAYNDHSVCKYEAELADVVFYAMDNALNEYEAAHKAQPQEVR